MQQLPRASEPNPAARSSQSASSAATRAEAEIGLYYIFVEEVLQRGAVGAADRFLSAEFVEHGMTGDRNRRDFIAHLGARRERFPNAEWTIETLIGVGGFVVCYMTMRAPGLPDPGWESVVIRFQSDRIAERWSICDPTLMDSYMDS